MLKKLLSILLTLAMLLSMIPAGFAADIEIVEEPVGADAPGGPLDEIVIDDPAEVDVPLAEGDVVASGECGDDLTWTLDDQGTLTISGTGDMWDFDGGKLAPWYEYSVSIVTAVIEEGVTSIGRSAFSDCPNLTRVMIPEGVTSIGMTAFSNSYALPSLAIPASVTSIGWSAFSGCWNLAEIVVAEGNQYYQSMNGVLLTKDGTRLILCPSGKPGEYSVPEGVAIIEDSAFDSCGLLTAVHLPGSLREIKAYAFFGCSSLAEVTIADGLLSIGGGAFSRTNLHEITFPASLQVLQNYDTGDAVFQNTPIENIYVAEDNPTFCSVDGVVFSKDQSELVMFPTGRTGGYTVPEGVTSLGFKAFDGVKLTEVILPEGLISIGEQAFQFAWDLPSLTIPSGVTGIGPWVFADCGLKEIRFEGAAPTFDEGCFAGLTATAYYPENDPSWTEDVRQDYDGTITWVAYDPSSTVVASGECGDDLIWTLDEEGTLTVSGTGDMWDFEWSDDTDATTAPWAEYINQVKTLVLDEGVTSIGNEAFDGFVNLTDVRLSNTVARLGEYSLQSIGVVSLYLPAGVTEIEDFAIYLCNNLTEITVNAANPAYCSVDGALFTNDLSELISYPIARSEAYEVPDGVTTISSGAFQRCTGLSAVSFPASLKVIEWGAFQSCSGLTELILPEGFTELGTCAFTACTGMKSAVLPQSLTEIGERAFQSCTALEDLTVSDRLERIGPYAFCNCNSLKSFVIPDSVTTIDQGAIAGCDSLAAFVVSASNPSFCEQDGVLFTKDGTELVQYPVGKPDRSYSVPQGTELIRYGAFFNSFLLTSVTLPEGLIEIGDWAFERCTDLAEISLPKNLQRIGYSAFAGCENLTELTLPEGLGELDEWVFDECDKLTTVIIEEGLTRIGNAAFYNCDSLSTVVLPDSLLYIGEWSFGHSTKLQTIELPANLVRVEDYAFYGCTSIDHAVFPASLEAIGDWSFSLTSITEMRFLGSAPAFGNGCFDTVTATAYYPENDPSWTEDVMQNYGGTITWVPYGEAAAEFTITLTDYTNGAAQTSLDFGASYSGSVTFTVSADWPVAVAVKKGDVYTALKCTTVDGEHRYTLNVTEDTELVFAFKGDVNLDGTVKSSEVTMIKRAIAGTYNFKNALAALAADINGDGSLKSSDATMLARSIAGTYNLKW